jgi:hypothetical protein
VFVHVLRRVARRRFVLLAGVSLAALMILNPGGKVSAAMASVAESIGLHDENDNLRVQVGAQDDGKYGLRIWDADGNRLYNFTDGGDQIGGSAPRVATTVAGLGTGMKDGEVGYLRLGTGSLDSVQVQWDDTRGKWVTAPQPITSVTAGFSTTSTVYAPVSITSSVRHPVLDLKELYDAGMRPEVNLQAYLHTSSGAATAFAQVGIGQIADGGVASTAVATGGEVSTNSTTSVVLYSDWTPMTVTSAPTEDHGFGYVLVRSSTGAATASAVSGLTDAQIRWAG